MNFENSYSKNVVTDTVHVFEKNRQLCDCKALIEKASDDSPVSWDDLQSIAPSTKNVGETISYDQALDYFRGADLSEYNVKIRTRMKKAGNNVFSYFSNLRKCKLKQEYVNDYNLLFLIAKCPYEKYNRTHEEMLRTVYDSLVSCKELDFSWQNIGFQSNLPWTDLRGVGMLGVLQLLYITTSHPVLSNRLYELSTNKLNSFPLAVISLNITSVILNLLRNDKLNRHLNKEGVFLFANKLHAVIFYRFQQIWTNEKKTILDIGNILRDIEKSCLSKRMRKTMLKNFERR